MIIPPNQLNNDTLNNILEEFITREGTDYGEEELSLAQKVNRLRPQVLSGNLLIIFDAKLELIQIVNKNDYIRNDNECF